MFVLYFIVNIIFNRHIILLGDTMNDKNQFKEFVRKNPNLIKYVRNGSKTWQDFYEIFNLYGESDSAWDEFLNENVSKSQSIDLLSWLKDIDLDSIQNGVASIQRVLGVVQDFANKEDVSPKEEYKPRPLYKHFED